MTRPRPLGRFPLVLVLGITSFAAAACSHAGPKPQRRDTVPHASHTDPTTALAPVKGHRTLVLMRGLAVGPVAIAGDYLVWETGGEQENPSGALLARNLRSEVVRTLARDPIRDYGLAVTPDAVMYAASAGTGVQLVAVAPDGSHRRVFAHSLLAPFDARGHIVAWAEGDSATLRVRVRNLSTGHVVTALERPRCTGSRCYRIDRVTVADQGIVFDLGAAGDGYPSLIARYRVGAAKPAFAEVRRDPQPDLARSSGGALYYQFQRGWMRWNFGHREPTLTRFREARPWLLDNEHGRLLVSTGEDCKDTLAVRLPGGHTFAPPAPATTAVSPRGFGSLCRRLTGFAWDGKRLVAAWSLIPSLSLQSHKDVGLAGIVIATHIRK